MTPLHELADALGIELLRPSAGGSFGAVPDETLLRLCRALGAAIERPADATDALAATYADRMRARIDPVTVAWDDDVPVLTLFRHSARRDEPFDVQVALESGTELVWTDRECRVVEVRDAHDGCVASSVALPRALPHGVHRVVVIDRAGDAAATIVAAPSRCGPERGAEWGLFAPLYALHDDVRPATADFGTLRRFADWAASHGAALVGTLPLLATFFGHGDEPCDPSPYAPVSRRYWNEAYLDTSSIVAQVAEPAAGPLVDLPAHAERLRRTLEPVARAISTDPALARWLARRPDVTEYAQFRSKLEGVGEGGVRYHQFVQWQCERQLASLADDLAARGQSLYLDFPLGTHPDGFDVAREPELFVRQVSVGAPPDAFHNAGQNWGFPPIHPAAARRTGYAYLRACLDAHLRFARVLRLDHVMGLHRLWFVPEGAAATDGAYVHYAAEEQWAVISLLASRHDAQIVGEDLGTVTNAAREALVAHGALRMWVSQFDTPPHLPMDSPGAHHLAGTGTHDLPTFATWWAELDSSRRATLLATLQTAGTLPRSAAEPAPAAVLGALYAWMGNSDAPIVLAALEDLWLETEPQNRPGTQALENFRRRAAYGIDAFDTVAGLPEILARLDTARERAEERPAMTILTADDLHLFNEGRHFRLYERLGAHLDGAGVRFSVWAPNARRVSLLGAGNGWTPGADALEPVGSSGIWTGRFPGWIAGDVYKYAIETRDGRQLEKADPFAFQAELPPRTASVVADLSYEWHDAQWMSSRGALQRLDAPISVYELHAGSWARRDDGTWHAYRDLAPRLIDYLHQTGFTHVELLPIMEHPFYGSWGYQTTGYYAPTSRYGSPTDFMAFVDELHDAGIGVILDWVPSHFPADAHGLATFDGTHLFEHADPRQGFHPDWKTLVFNYGRNEVRSFLTSSACFWLDRYHVDGLRVDAVASMLYLDYSREDGQWIPNEFGGRENLDAIRFLRELNEEVYRAFPDTQTYAEESTAWPMVSRPTYVGGLGFGFKWDMGWMHDTLQHVARDPVHRRFHYSELTFRGVYAWTENYILPLSHDEVVHGKGSLAAKMPGDRWQQLANLRTLLAYQWATPGKKLLFMGGEIGQWREWDHESVVDWSLLDDEAHAGVQQLVSDLNRMLRSEAALHQRDCDADGFGWAVADDADDGVLGFYRYDAAGAPLLFIANFTPVVRDFYRVPVPCGGFWRELVNTDATPYGGSGSGNLGGVDAVPIPLREWYWSLTLQVPPLGALFLRPDP